MKAVVITIMKNQASVEVANRCIESGKRFGVKVEKFKATVPQQAQAVFEAQGWNPQLFFDKYNRPHNAMACFISHYRTWYMCAEMGEPLLVMEHDAVVVDDIPEPTSVRMIASLGKPSYGKFLTPPFFGFGQLTSKKYFPGAHGYIIQPRAAKELMDSLQSGRLQPAPTDLFFNRANMPWLQEYHPWPIEARDSFTTVQQNTGCFAKHSYQKDPNGFRIENV